MDVPGKTIISDEVFIDLARTSLTKVTEVSHQEKRGTIAGLTSLITEKLAPQIIVKRAETEATDDQLGKVVFDMKLTLLYGMNIPETVKKVRTAVTEEVQSYTGYQVERIDVIVDKLVKPEKIEGV